MLLMRASKRMPTTMDEEAQKRNTDCVYFLASPLTCKKGNGCEFRHSEAARMNPQDCWYWLGGNCLNTSCSFRHPPLDGRPGSSSAAFVAPVSSATATTSATAASKSRVPCYFFSQGYCVKGDRCSFLHGPSLPASAQAAIHQKPPKAPIGRGVETSDKPASVVKGNVSTVYKPGAQDFSSASWKRPAQSLPSNVFVRAQESPPIQNDASRARVFEGSATSSPSRHQSAHVSSERFHHPPDSANRALQGQPVEKRQQQPQAKDELWREADRHTDARLQQGFSLDERKQNGIRTDGLWKEESLGFGGDESDGSVYRENGEYLLVHDDVRDRPSSQRRTKHLDDSEDFEYHAYDRSRYYSTPYPHEHGYPEQLSEYDYRRGVFDRMREHRTSPYNARRVRQGVGGDLRDHLTKRRKSDRNQYLGVDGLGRHFQDMVDYPHLDERHLDDSFKQVPSQRGRENHRRLSGREDSRGFKRLHHDSGSDYEGNSPYRVSLGSSPAVSDHLRVKSTNRESDWYGSEEARGYSTQELSGFAAPKSLAQIRAERRMNADVSFQSQGLDGPRSEIHLGSYSSFAERPVIKSQILPASSSDFGREDLKGSAIYRDFEGPKPLSGLLQEKQKAEADRDKGFKETRMERAATEKRFWLGSNKGEILQDPDNALKATNRGERKHENLHDSYPTEMLMQEGLASRWTSGKGRAHDVREKKAEEAKEAMVMSEDILGGGIDTGDNLSGDGYGLDDDDNDDFARVGFF